MPVELKKWADDAKAAIYQLTSEQKTLSADTKKSLTDFLAKYNDVNEKFAADKKANADALAAVEKKAVEAETRVKDLEQKIAQGIGHSGGPALDDSGAPNPNAIERTKPEYKTFMALLAAGKGSEASAAAAYAASMERKDGSMLRTDSLTAGGYLVPPVTDSVIRKKVIELSPVRAFATQRSLPSKTMSIPTQKALLDSFFEGEAEEAQESESQYGEETVTAWRHAVRVRMTYDQLIMSPFNMEMEISSDVGKSFAKKEGWMFLKGDGSKKPAGCLVDNRVTGGAAVSKTAATITFDDMANLIGSMKNGYNPVLFFGRGTFAQLIQLKDSQNRPLWTPVAGDKPATIWDQPYTSTFIDMDQMATGSGTTNAVSNSIPIMYADLAAGYEIFDVQGMSVIRDDITQAARSIIIYNFRRYLTAKTIMPEAIKLLKVR